MLDIVVIFRAMLGPGTARKTSMVTLQTCRGSAVGNPLVVSAQVIIMPSRMHSYRLLLQGRLMRSVSLMGYPEIKLCAAYDGHVDHYHHVFCDGGHIPGRIFLKGLSDPGVPMPCRGWSL